MREGEGDGGDGDGDDEVGTFSAIATRGMSGWRRLSGDATPWSASSFVGVLARVGEFDVEGFVLVTNSKQSANGRNAIQMTGEKQEIRAMVDKAIIERLDELRAPLSVPWVDVSRTDVLRAVILVGLRCIDVEKTRAELLPMASGEEGGLLSG